MNVVVLISGSFFGFIYQ